MIQVIVVDDHSLFRKGLKAIFKADHPDIVVSGEAESGETLFRILPATPADLVLLDINLPGGIGGAETARRLRRDYPALKILAISAENTTETITSMIDAGIDGFISKQQGQDSELAEAIRTVMSGLNYFGRDISFILYDVVKTRSLTLTATPDFSARELEIIRLCRDGLVAKQIADRLGISISTVNTHKERIFQKIGINSTLEMVHYALKKGIIRIEN
jgi:two-component system response regulator NreC